jgi:hypothetical protein
MKWTILVQRLCRLAIRYSRLYVFAGFLLSVVGLMAQTTLAQMPQITSVSFSGSAGNYSLTIQGTGFGSSTVSLPFTGDVSNFRIGDSVTFNEWGYTGDADVLSYESWSNSKIVVSGFGGQPGDAITIALWNASSKQGASWGGKVPTTASTPEITSVELSGTGQDVQIVVNGSGFGSAPTSMPDSSADLNFFRFTDFRAHCGSSSSLFEAGFNGWGVLSPDTVTLNYTSWMDTQIVIAGFGGTYGEGCATYQAGDPVAIVVYNTEDTSQTGLQTAWGGPAAASITISVKDLTTDKRITPGGTITAGDEFQVTVTSGPTFNCAGQFVVTALGAAGAAPSVLVQSLTFVIGPASGGNTATGGTLTSNGSTGHLNDWKISASCNGSTNRSFAFSNFEFFSAVP